MPFTYTGSAGSGSRFSVPDYGGAGIDSVLSAQPDEGGGILGFLGNVVEGVVGVGKGIGSLVGAGIHDYGQAVGDILPGTQEWGVVNDTDERSYLLDDIAKQMAGFTPEGFDPLAEGSILGDLADRYGPLLPGGEPASEAYERMYEDPVAYILDAAAVAGGVSKAVGIAGKARIAGTAGEAVAKSALAELAGEVAPRTARAAAIRKGLESIGQGDTLVAKLLPEARANILESGNVVRSAEAYNPLYRAVQAPLRRYGLTKSIDDLRAAREALPSTGDLAKMPGSEKLQADAAYLDRIIKAADENDLTRVERPQIITARTNLRAKKMLAEMKGRQYTARDAEIRRRLETLTRYLKEDPELLDQIPLKQQGLDLRFEGLDPDSKIMAANPDIRNAQGQVVPLGDSMGDDLPAGTTHANARTPEGGLSSPEPPQRAMRWHSDCVFCQTDTPHSEHVYDASALDDADLDAPIQPGEQSVDDMIRTTPDIPSEAGPMPEGATGWTPNRGWLFGGGDLRLSRPSSGVATLTRPAARLTPEEVVATLGREGLVERTEAVVAQIREHIDYVNRNRDAMLEGGWSEARLAHEVEGAERAIAGLEDGVQRLAVHKRPDIDQSYSAAERYIDEARLEEWEEMAPGFRTGLSPAQVLDRAYVPLRGLHGTRFDYAAEDDLRKAEAALQLAERNMKQRVDKLRREMTRKTKTTETAARQAERAQDAVKTAEARARRARQTTSTHKAALEAPHVAEDRLAALTAREQAKVDAAALAVDEAKARVDAGFQGGPSVAELDDAIRASGKQQPVYFAHIDAENMNTSDFFTNRSRVGANIMAADPHNKQMKLALLERGTWLRDPIEVAKRRGARHLREVGTFELWDRITRETGFEISDPGQVPKGFKLVAPDLMFVQHKTRMRLLDKLDQYLTEGADSDAALSRALSETLDANYDDVRRLMDADDVKMYAVPESVLKNLDAAAKWAPAFGGKAARLYVDTPMNIWRGLTLTASPRWVINNVLGNTAFGLMQGVKVADVVRIGTEKFRVLMENWVRRRQGLPEIAGPRERSLTAQTQRLMREGKVEVGHGYIGTYAEEPTKNLGQAASETAMGKAIIAARSSKAGGLTQRWGDAVKHLNAILEDTSREASFLAALEKGQGKAAITRTARSFWGSKKRIEDIMEGGFKGKDAAAQGKAALDEVNRFFGNYGSMTPFERHVIRRWLFPFWGFYRHSSKLILTFPFEYPARAQVLNAIASANEEMMEQYGELPEWLSTAVPLGPPGTDRFLTTRGANPFSGAAEGVAGVASMLGPIPKTILEQSLGRDLFTGREFTDAGVVTPYGSDQQYRIIYDDEGNPIGSEPIDKVAPGLVEGLLGQIPQYDVLKSLLAGGRPYDTASLFDAVQERFGNEGEATPIDPETGEPYSQTSFLDQLTKLGGLPTTVYDVEGYQERLAREREAVMLEALRRAGAA